MSYLDKNMQELRKIVFQNQYKIIEMGEKIKNLEEELNSLYLQKTYFPKGGNK